MDNSVKNVLQTWALAECLDDGAIDLNRKNGKVPFYRTADNYDDFIHRVNILIDKKSAKADLKVNVYLDLLDTKKILKKFSKK
ncbi:hypothetical protein G6R29_00930 [Fructobacillus sp. M2-14]|uniref:Uncharacterized protein n=1 Tax=Fructobacillus broussonetiae TaxID=2713173 RepID=A0ABS5QYZ9_9LACO|nr:hypothetical protein [Fructobacillus broussonetiae]MBS9338197.1 hypothetical protein [Fructobacillus broussonetiae]